MSESFLEGIAAFSAVNSLLDQMGRSWFLSDDDGVRVSDTLIVFQVQMQAARQPPIHRFIGVRLDHAGNIEARQLSPREVELFQAARP